MGFLDWIRGAKNKVVNTARKVGSFVENTVKPTLGKIAGTAKKVAHFVNTNPAAIAIGDALSNVPVLGRVVNGIQKAAKYADKGADIVNSGLQLSDDLNTAVKNKDFNAAAGLIDRGKGVYRQGKAYKNGF